MKRDKYYPKAQSDQPGWLINFATQLLARGAEVNLTTDVINAAVADALYLAYAVGQWLKAVRGYGPDCTAAVDLLEHGSGSDPLTLPDFTAPPLPGAASPLPAVVAVAPGALDRIVALVQVIKASVGYTEELGLALGIVGSESGTPGAPTGPKFSLKTEQGSGVQVVKVKFKKGGHMAVAIYSRRGTGGWELLGIATGSPHTDDRALLAAGTPEVREYKVRFWDDGAETGEWSDVAKATVAP